MNGTITQPYGANYNGYYLANGLKGHMGVDYVQGYGSPIKAFVKGAVYALRTLDNPTNDGYTCVYTLCRTPLEDFEFSYGHLNPTAVIGMLVNVGDQVGTEANHGTVFSGGTQITLAMQKAGDRRGSHLHAQKRPIKRVLRTVFSKRYLQNGDGLYRDTEGYYYEVYDNDNGFAGCTDFLAPLFQRNLMVGNSGYDVLLLQRALILERYLQVEPTAFFGPKTFLAVQALQRKESLTPVGICGPKTRGILNKSYPPLNLFFP